MSATTATLPPVDAQAVSDALATAPTTDKPFSL